MTEAEKALDRIEIDVETFLGKDRKHLFDEIRKALQGAAKTQGLLKALKHARIDVNVGRGAHWIIKDIDAAINNFNSDETEVGL